MGPGNRAGSGERLILKSDRTVGRIMGCAEQAKPQIVSDVCPGKGRDAMIPPLGHVDQFVGEQLRFRPRDNPVEDPRADHDGAPEGDGLHLAPKQLLNSEGHGNEYHTVEWQFGSTEAASVGDNAGVDAHTTRLRTLGSLAITFRGSSPPVWARTRSDANAIATASTSVIVTGTSIRSRTFPFT